MDPRKDYSTGVSPIIATLLLIAITVSAGIIVYVFVSGITGGLTQGGGQQTGEQVELTSYAFTPLSGTSLTCDGQSGVTAPCITISIKNAGGSAVTIDQMAVYFDGQPLTVEGSPMLTLNTDEDATYLLANAGVTTGFIGVPTGISGGTTNTLKLVTTTGALFAYTMTAGASQ